MAEATDDRLRLLIERIERLEEEKKGIADDIRDVYAEAKAVGYDTKIMRQIIKLRKMKRAEVHHLRQGYVLADLYERAGDAARARELFRWVAAEEPEFADAVERASSLG